MVHNATFLNRRGRKENGKVQLCYESKYCMVLLIYMLEAGMGKYRKLLEDIKKIATEVQFCRAEKLVALY